MKLSSKFDKTTFSDTLIVKICILVTKLIDFRGDVADIPAQSTKQWRRTDLQTPATIAFSQRSADIIRGDWSGLVMP